MKKTKNLIKLCQPILDQIYLLHLKRAHLIINGLSIEKINKAIKYYDKQLELKVNE